MYEMLFHYYPAFVAQVVDASRVRVWLQHPKNDHINYDLDKTIILDLDKTPSNTYIEWDDIEVDDYVNNAQLERRGFTTIGPVTPHYYGAGGVYISLSYYRRHLEEMIKATKTPSQVIDPKKIEDITALAGYAYEEVALVRRDGQHLQRFHGFHRFGKNELKPHTLIVVAHAGLSREKYGRARAAVLIQDPKVEVSPLPRESWPEEYRVRGLPFETSSVTAVKSEENAIYLSRSTAIAAELDVPKRPSGSGGGKLSLDELMAFSAELRGGPTKEGEQLVQGGPLNVLEEHPYDEIARIQHRLRKNRIRVSNSGLIEKLQSLSRAKLRFTSLDLIAHSAHRDGILRFNGLSLVADAMEKLFNHDVVDAIRKLGISEVRILGCHTASSQAARDALSALSLALQHSGTTRIAVRATRADLFAVHYVRGVGFAEDRLLVEDRLPDEEVIVGDPPPQDDEVVKRQGGSGAHPPHPPVSSRLSGLSDFPRQQESSSVPEYYYQWNNPEFGALNACVDFTRETGNDPRQKAFGQVLFIDNSVVRAFELIKKDQNEQGPTPAISHIRLSFRNRWSLYAVTLPQPLYALIGPPLEAPPPVLRTKPE